MANAPLQIHIWPGRWELPSIDGSCIEAVLYLQLTFPNRYAIIETADPDQSPNGQLPFLTHGQLVISSLPSIVSYLSHLNASLLSPLEEANDAYDSEDEPQKVGLDASLGNLQASQAAAWRAYIEAQLGDIIAHSFLVLYPNYSAFTRELLASMLPVPQRYYVPNRIKESYRPRLEAAGLWALANEPDEPAEGETKTAHSEFRRSFGQMKLTERARLVFDILSRLLGEKPFLFGDRPVATDVAMASRILLLVRAPLPNPILKEVLEKSYSNLVDHASRTYSLAFAPGTSSPPPPPVLSQPRVNPLRILRGSLSYLGNGFGATKDESEEAKRFRRYRWGWFALVLAGVVKFFAASTGRVQLAHGEDGDGNDDADSEDASDDDQEFST